MDHFRINSFEQKNAALVFSVQYAQWAIHTNNTIKKNRQQTRKNLFEKCVGPEKGRLLQLGYRRSTSLVEHVVIQLLRLNRRAFLMLL
jgi:hypothetical protein